MKVLKKEKNEQVEAGEGRKDDEEKLRWDLLPWAALEEVVYVLQYGAKKYGEYNWQKVKNHRSRYFSACMRHLVDWWAGSKFDSETSASHLAHAIACLLFLLYREGEVEEKG